MWLKRIGEKNCSQRFHAIYIVFEVVHFKCFPCDLMKQSLDIQKKVHPIIYESLYTL